MGSTTAPPPATGSIPKDLFKGVKADVQSMSQSNAVLRYIQRATAKKALTKKNFPGPAIFKSATSHPLIPAAMLTARTLDSTIAIFVSNGLTWEEA